MLGWDEEVMMPQGGANARNSSLVTLATILHQRLKNGELQKQIADVEIDTPG